MFQKNNRAARPEQGPRPCPSDPQPCPSDPQQARGDSTWGTSRGGAGPCAVGRGQIWLLRLVLSWKWLKTREVSVTDPELAVGAMAVAGSPATCGPRPTAVRGRTWSTGHPVSWVG